jgi:hypothetical protein
MFVTVQTRAGLEYMVNCLSPDLDRERLSLPGGLFGGVRYWPIDVKQCFEEMLLC